MSAALLDIHVSAALRGANHFEIVWQTEVLKTKSLHCQHRGRGGASVPVCVWN